MPDSKMENSRYRYRCKIQIQGQQIRMRIQEEKHRENISVIDTCASISIIVWPNWFMPFNWLSRTPRQTAGRKPEGEGARTDRQTERQTDKEPEGREGKRIAREMRPMNQMENFTQPKNEKLQQVWPWLGLDLEFAFDWRPTGSAMENLYLYIYKYRNSNLVVVKHLWQITIHWAGLSSVSLGLCFCQLTVQCNRRLWSVCLCEHLVTTRAPLCVAPLPQPLPQPLPLRLRFGSISISSGLLNWGLSIKLN